MGRLMTISEASDYLNVSQGTLRYWEAHGKINVVKTIGGHRRFDVDSLDAMLGIERCSDKACATYARVSSHEQKAKGDLDRQSQRLSEYCARKGFLVSEIIKDVGSGVNASRKGFERLVGLVTEGKVKIVVVENRDRLTRFQFEFVEKMFNSYGCKIVVTDGKDDVSDMDELTEDMISILASYAGKLYGRRSAERRKRK